MTQVDRDAFIRELSTEPAVLIRAVVRAFLAAALRGQDALTPAAWRSVIRELRYKLGSALPDGLESRRPVRPRPLVSVNSATGQDFQVQLVRMLVAAYVATQMSGDEAATPEGRSRILRSDSSLLACGSKKQVGAGATERLDVSDVEERAQADLVSPWTLPDVTITRPEAAATVSDGVRAPRHNRSTLMGKTRELVWDGMLDAVKQRLSQPARCLEALGTEVCIGLEADRHTAGASATMRSEPSEHAFERTMGTKQNQS